MTRAVLVVSGDIETLTGGYGCARRMLEILPEQGMSIELLQLADECPFPTEAAIGDARRKLESVPGHTALIIDGLAYGALPEDLLRDLDRPLVALIHHPLGLEFGLAPDLAEMLIE